MTEPETITVLLVDDEVNILNSLRRLLRKEPWTLLTAESGEQALELAKQHSLDLVISDARMPGMDGATLLAEIQRSQPGCIRILLTGYADISTTVRAINEGRIYRYISKPWDDAELLMTMHQGLAFQLSERERERLEKLTQAQNDELLELNETLEFKVKARTSELEQTADMLDLAFAELKRSYVVSTQVFATMLQQRLPRERQTNEAVISLVKAWAERRDMPPAERENLTMAAALYNIGKVTWNDDLLSKPADLLYKEYRQIYRQYPEIGEGFLMALEPLQDAARLIRQHMERWDGLGFPDKLQGAAIPLGAQMLRLAVEFVELQAGIVLDHKVNRDNALAWVKRYSGKLYDPVLADEFIGFCRQQLSDPDAPHYDELLLDTRRASPGMSLSRDLYAANGLLLLNAGKLLTRTLLDKLTSFEVTEGVRYPLYVQAPSAPESQLPGKEKSL